MRPQSREQKAFQGALRLLEPENEAALSAGMKRLWDASTRLANRLVRDEHDAEDIVQTAWTAAIEHERAGGVWNRWELWCGLCLKALWVIT